MTTTEKAETTPPVVDATLDPIPTDWDPDKRWFHPLLAALALYALAFLPHWMHLPGWVMAPTGLAFTAAAVITARVWVDEDTFGAKHETHAKRLTIAAGLAATGWLVFADGDPTNPTALGLLVLWTVTFGIAYALWRSKEPQRQAERAEQKEEIAERRAEHERHLRASTYQQLWGPWLAKCERLGGVVVDDFTDTKAGYTLTLADDPTDGQVATFTALTDAIPTLAVLASKHYAKQGIELGVNDIRAEETSMAHVWLLHVSTKQPLKKDVPHPGIRPVTTIKEPVNPGIYEDGEPIEISMLGEHTVVVGGTGSGKSILAHNFIAEFVRRHDLELWCCGVKKMMPLVGPWLHPWLTGLTDRPVIQRIGGENIDEVLLMLADFYMAASLQNKRLGFVDKRKPTPEDPALVLIIDEATSLAKITEPKIETFDGRVWTASALLDEICSMARSAGYGVFFLTQFGLVDALGPHGTNTLRNINVRIAGRTNSYHDGSATLNGIKSVDTTKLRNNTFMVQPNREQARVIPSKAYSLVRDGELDLGAISAMAVAYTPHRPTLPAWLVGEMGESYTERWNPERQKDLADFLESQGLPYPRISPEVTGAVHLNPRPAETPSELIVSPDHGTLDPEGVWATPNNGMDTPQEETMTRSLDFNSEAAAMEAALERMAAERKRRSAIRSGVISAIKASNAPAFCAAWKLALAAHLVARDAPRADIDAAGDELVAYFTAEPYELVPERRGDELGWQRDVLESRIRQVMREEAGDSVPAPRETDRADIAVMAPVIAAIDELGDDEWKLVGELGREAGAVTAEDAAQARLEAGRFGTSLRQAPWNLPDTAFKRTASGNAVNVGALRRAAGVTV
ncbi:hypothetical protein [Amycolatopsis thermophila]|uniref:AAA+ ATPase domain-containing protein n=1 Tax=Amycolatopsis thermophila TaxID=206084 RepID=A0ABU0EMM8_9PSEU|nr:hypothetical protein [Amycolatopsis thermophila]MDQ0376526.1 hypothetical protein [Amycolatopsis thermophila]